MVGTKVYPFQPGAVSVINAGIPHIARAGHAEGSRWAFLSIDPYRFVAPFAADLSVQRVSELSRPRCPAVLHNEDNVGISSLVMQIFSELQSSEDCGMVCVSSLIVALLCKLSRINCQDTTSESKYAGIVERIIPALNIVAQRYSEDITIHDLADACCMSEPQLRRLFLRGIGRSPGAYVTGFRLAMALSLLEDPNLAIADIAGRVGYSSISSFNRNFRSEFKICPREWREAHRVVRN